MYKRLFAAVFCGLFITLLTAAYTKQSTVSGMPDVCSQCGSHFVMYGAGFPEQFYATGDEISDALNDGSRGYGKTISERQTINSTAFIEDLVLWSACSAVAILITDAIHSFKNKK
ncbi:MAG TPA: hypothetical protein VG604_03685 [Candidatus Saccharimonadales bacterium]|nr:hypothetical protein [Candidatus Saccharimonadales bacterium]